MDIDFERELHQYRTQLDAHPVSPFAVLRCRQQVDVARTEMCVPTSAAVLERSEQGICECLCATTPLRVIVRIDESLVVW